MSPHFHVLFDHLLILAAVKLVMEAVCHLLSVKPKRINDPNDPSKKINDFWGPSQVGDSTCALSPAVGQASLHILSCLPQ
jgi:hypothetical protein